jgi:type II restriction enzyme
MKNYITKSVKSKPIRKIINEALEILDFVGIPLADKTERAMERMAVSFLAIAGVTSNWKQAKNNTNLKTRDIINFVNENFEEKISSGSYDDIRRKDLKLLILSNLIINSGASKGSATNDPTRGYALHPLFLKLIIKYNTPQWEQALSIFKANKQELSNILARKRDLQRIPVKLPSGKKINLSFGKHNILQKQVVEEFLPRFGCGCELLYIGDTANKLLHIEQKRLDELQFFRLLRDKLPDIVAYNELKNWLYLIEAVHSSGTMSETRILELKQLSKDCKAEPIFITAFSTKADFKKWIFDIAWETEVWVADNPDHMIHFNGDKFLGTYKND